MRHPRRVLAAMLTATVFTALVLTSTLSAIIAGRWGEAAGDIVSAVFYGLLFGAIIRILRTASAPRHHDDED